MNTGLLLYAFSAGMVATVNPCGFAMLPAFISYYLATEDSAPQRGARALLRALYVGGVVTAGFVLLFTVAGGVISLGAYALVTAMPWIGLLVGVILVVLGVWMLAGHHITVPGLPELRVPRQRSMRSMFLFGVAYGLASLSCTLPIFLIVVGTSFTTRGPLVGIGQFVAYGVGMGLILMGLTVGLALFRDVALGTVRQVLPHVERVGALLLTLAGGYIVYYWLFIGGLLIRFAGS